MTSVDHLRATADDGPAGPEAGTPPRQRSPFTLLLAVAPFVGVLTTIALLAQRASRPLSNADTYFHLRFGHEFLDGDWSLRNPGSVTTFGTNDWTPTQWLPQVVMAQLEEWFGLPGVAWLAGLLHIGLVRDALVHRPAVRQPAGRRDRRRPRHAHHLPRAVHAAAGAELPARRRHRDRLARHPRGPQGPLVAGPADLGLGDGPRHVAGRDHHRLRGRWRASRWTARPRDASGSGSSSSRCSRASRPRSPRSVRSCTARCCWSTRAPSTSPSGSRPGSPRATASRS